MTFICLNSGLYNTEYFLIDILNSIIRGGKIENDN